MEYSSFIQSTLRTNYITMPFSEVTHQRLNSDITKLAEEIKKRENEDAINQSIVSISSDTVMSEN